MTKAQKKARARKLYLLRNRPKFLKQYEANHEAYEENFKLILAHPDNKKYLKREDYLERRCIALQQKLGTYIPNPCILEITKDCWDCTGYFKLRVPKILGKSRYIECSKEDGGGYCNLKYACTDIYKLIRGQ